MSDFKVLKGTGITLLESLWTILNVIQLMIFNKNVSTLDLSVKRRKIRFLEKY
jgi:hypothetical protein